jgi:UDP-N-acetylglucosamine diphosphorylase/glucosamine-1-phosphate N-acetyltransferase
MSGICIFEDEGYKELLPITWFSPVFDLRCGLNTLYEKIKRYYPRTNIYILCRDYLNNVVKRNHAGAFVGKINKEQSILFINGRLLCDKEIPKKIPVSGGDEIFECNGIIVAARLSKGNLEMISNTIKSPINAKDFSSVRSTAKTTKISVKMIDRFFDLVAANREEIANDFNFHTRGGITRGKVHQTISVYARGGIFIDDGAEIEPFVTLDARGGQIFISKGSKIMPYSRIEGPAFIGEKSVISTGANIRSGTSIGPNCRVGGEIEETIFHSFSNKQHYGFLGHSYVGQWVNIGAGATNSDLKNNYSNVKISYMGEEIDSGRMFLGCAIADHAKIGIGTLINTGSIIGAAANVFGGSMTSKFIPSFSWGDKEYDPERAIKTAQTVMSRRDVVMEESDIDLFRKVFELTEPERRQFIN